MQYNNTQRWFGNTKFYFFITIIFFTFTILCFTWEIWDTLSCKLPIDPSVWGQFGDFIGGTLGVIFSLISVMLVVWTFKTQNKTAETQRFNDLFFELLKLYQEQEKELQYRWEDSENTYMSNNKDFFYELNKRLSEKFIPTISLSKNRKEAIKTYVETTIDYKNKLSLCYRTIYQILNLIENSQLENKDRIEYLKILRSQFTESELLFIRYHIKSGEYRKFAFLVNKSNLLKHLPLFELLEFKYWKEKLDKMELKSANDLFMEFKKALRNNNNYILSQDKSLGINIYKTYRSIKIVFEKRDNSSWTSKFTTKEFENLCEVLFKEIVMFSNYSCYNNYRELYFVPAKTNNNTTTVEVVNKKDNIIHVRFDNTMTLDKIDKIF